MASADDHFVYKVCAASEWRDATVTGAYSGSAVDRRDGFIHFSTSAQLAETVRRHFAGQRDLVLVAVDPGALGAHLRWEPSRGGDLFPHLYGDLPVSLAQRVTPLDVEADGRPRLRGTFSLSISIDATPSVVWEVLTQGMATWIWHEPVRIDAEWRAGSPLLMRGTLNDEAFENRGRVDLVEAPKELQYRYWSSLSASVLPDAPESYTVVRFVLAAAEESTHLSVTLSEIPHESVYEHARLYWSGTLPLIKELAEEQATRRRPTG
jgi:uncharacterized protein (DUF952 family)